MTLYLIWKTLRSCFNFFCSLIFLSTQFSHWILCVLTEQGFLHLFPMSFILSLSLSFFLSQSVSFILSFFLSLLVFFVHILFLSFFLSKQKLHRQLQIQLLQNNQSLNMTQTNKVITQALKKTFICMKTKSLKS